MTIVTAACSLLFYARMHYRTIITNNRLSISPYYVTENSFKLCNIVRATHELFICVQQSWTDIEPVARRELQQQAGQAELTIVKSAQQLIDAVDAGALHIEIRDHLDLTTATPRDTNSSWVRMLNDNSASTKDFGLSIRVLLSRLTCCC